MYPSHSCIRNAIFNTMNSLLLVGRNGEKAGQLGTSGASLTGAFVGVV